LPAAPRALSAATHADVRLGLPKHATALRVGAARGKAFIKRFCWLGCANVVARVVRVVHLRARTAFTVHVS
jgi:hypothetical protein